MFDDLHGLDSTSSTLTYTRQYDCLNRITGQGLQIQYRFPRTSYRRSPNMVHVELIFTNTTTNKDIQSIKFLKSICLNIQGFDEIELLPNGTSIVASIGIDFNDKTQPAIFDISFDGNILSTSLSISCHVGELIEQKFLNETDFNQNLGTKNIDCCCFFLLFFFEILARLRGMNEITDNINIPETQFSKLNFSTIQTKVLQSANVVSVPSSSGDSTVFR